MYGGLFYTPALLSNNETLVSKFWLGMCFSARESLTNVSLNEYKCWSLLVSLEADLCSACVSRIFLVGLFLMLVASQWKGPLHLLPSHLGSKQEGGKTDTGGPSVLVHLLQLESKAFSRSSTQQTLAHSSRARPGSHGSASCKGGWESWGFRIPAFTAEVTDS